MKKKLLGFTVILVTLALWNYSSGQETRKSAGSDKVVWLGVDFTAAKFILVTDDPQKIVDQYLPSINRLIITEQEKFNIRKFFRKKEVINNIELALERNSKIDPSQLVTTNDYKLDPQEVNKILKKYNLKENTGTGLIYIADNLNKATQIATFYVCFFDLQTKEITDSGKITGKASGIGFRNYWAGAIFDTMKKWALRQ